MAGDDMLNDADCIDSIDPFNGGKHITESVMLSIGFVSPFDLVSQNVLRR